MPDGEVEFISTRPGRVDKAVELGYMENADKKKMARRILGAYEKHCLEVLHFVDKFPDLPETPTQFQERCAQVALKCFWAEKLAEESTRPTAPPVSEGALNPTLKGSVPEGGLWPISVLIARLVPAKTGRLKASTR